MEFYEFYFFFYLKHSFDVLNLFLLIQLQNYTEIHIFILNIGLRNLSVL